MAEVTIWHNPRCSKSRAVLALLREKGVEPEIRLYLSDPPGREEITAARATIGCPLIKMVRTGEKTFKELGLSKDSGDETLLGAMVESPILIERPVVFSGGRAVIGRPPENVLAIV